MPATSHLRSSLFNHCLSSIDAQSLNGINSLTNRSPCGHSTLTDDPTKQRVQSHRMRTATKHVNSNKDDWISLAAHASSSLPSPPFDLHLAATIRLSASFPKGTLLTVSDVLASVPQNTQQRRQLSFNQRYGLCCCQPCPRWI